MIRKIFLLKILLLPGLLSMNLYAQTVEVMITGIRDMKGQILIGVFKDNESFQKEKALIEKKYVKNDMPSGEMKVQFSLEAGTYGLSLLDDWNSNFKMDYNFLGIPKEGFGFSDYYHSGITKPKFDSFKFSLNQGETRRITIRIRYM